MIILALAFATAAKKTHTVKTTDKHGTETVTTTTHEEIIDGKGGSGKWKPGTHTVKTTGKDGTEIFTTTTTEVITLTDDLGKKNAKAGDVVTTTEVIEDTYDIYDTIYEDIYTEYWDILPNCYDFKQKIKKLLSKKKKLSHGEIKKFVNGWVKKLRTKKHKPKKWAPRPLTSTSPFNQVWQTLYKEYYSEYWDIISNGKVFAYEMNELFKKHGYHNKLPNSKITYKIVRDWLNLQRKKHPKPKAWKPHKRRSGKKIGNKWVYSKWSAWETVSKSTKSTTQIMSNIINLRRKIRQANRHNYRVYRKDKQASQRIRRRNTAHRRRLRIRRRNRDVRRMNQRLLKLKRRYRNRNIKFLGRMHHIPRRYRNMRESEIVWQEKNNILWDFYYYQFYQEFWDVIPDRATFVTTIKHLLKKRNKPFPTRAVFKRIIRRWLKKQESTKNHRKKKTKKNP